MKTQQTGWIVALFVAVAGSWCSTTWTAEPEDGALPAKAQRLAFLKGYHSWSPRERRESLKLLFLPEYRNNPMIGAALHDVALFDKDPESREAAFKSLCEWQDRDGRLAYHLARLFKLELENAIKPRMAQAMTKLKFKTDILNVLIDYTFSPGIDYPRWGGYDYRYDRGFRANWDGWKTDNFRILLDAINKISGQHFVPSHDADRQVMKWWHLNAVDFQEDDRKLAERLKGNSEEPETMGAVVMENGPKGGRELAEVLDRQEKEGAKAKRTQEILKTLEPTKNPVGKEKVDEDEIE